MEIEINFTVTTEYTWSGELTDLPAIVRKGGKLTRREDGETVLNDDTLSERLDDEDALAALVKNAEEQSSDYSLDDFNEI